MWIEIDKVGQKLRTLDRNWK